MKDFKFRHRNAEDTTIHGDFDHISVEGHFGTWYVVNEMKLDGEKFFLLEHEKYGMKWHTKDQNGN